MTTLVVGRGLLGSNLVRTLRAQGDDVRTVDVPWARPADALRALLGAAAETASSDGTWRLAWCAGAGVIATSPEALEEEAQLFVGFLSGLSPAPAAMLLASSVGGAYGGSPDPPPYTETSRTGATGAYGRTKLQMEAVAAELAGRGTRLVVVRIANLYGPGQNLAKPQGLISQLCLSQLTGRPLGVYASLDTLRDYLYAPDAAAMAAACLERVAGEPSGAVVTKILASGRAASIGALIAESGRLWRRRPRISTRPSTAPMTDLRVRSACWRDIDALARTPLVVGLRATADDIARQLRAGRLQGSVGPPRPR